MVEIEIIDRTENPVSVISRCAGLCYGKDDVSYKRVMRCAKEKHDSVFEHAFVTFKLDGVSRNLTHQLVRHRMMSPHEKSLRYVKLGESNPYVYPASIWDNEDLCARYNEVLDKADEFYTYAIEHGVPAEDARYALPSAIETSIVITMNVRELKHICDMRIDKHAQWEIRDAMRAAMRELRLENDEWAWIVDEYIMEGDDL